MHYHLQIIMPPTDDVEDAVKNILAPFSEHLSDEETEPEYVGHKFWDFYEIGGRYENLKSKMGTDICSLDLFDKSQTCYHIMIVGRDEHWLFQYKQDIWNGSNFQKITWDGTINGAFDEYRKSMETYKDDYVARNTPTADWIAVTVDYHS